MSAVIKENTPPDEDRSDPAVPLSLVEHVPEALDAEATQIIPHTEDPQPVDEVGVSPPPPVPEAAEAAPVRLMALDAFRGLTILGMLLVNNIAMGDATPDQMTHAEMGQIHLADLVFPWFLLIVGVAIPYAAASRSTRGVPYWKYLFKALGRAATLVALGCFLDSSALHRPVFDLNVLQLIGLAYFVTVLAYILPLPLRLSIAAGLLLGHTYLLMHVVIPGVGRGVITDTQNVIAFWNQAFLSRWHLSGLTSVIPTAALALVGTALGDVLRSVRLSATRKFLALVLAGALMTTAGAWWSHSLPMSKPLWTASYILYTAGWGSLILAAFYAVLDARGWRAWAFPLLVFGSNAIFAYVAPIVTKIYILQGWTVVGPSGAGMSVQEALLRASSEQFTRPVGGALYTACYVLFWWLVLLFLYRRRLFLRV